MKTIVVLCLLALLSGCAIPITKPDWNPGTKAPAPQAEKKEKETCPLPSAEWVWYAEYQQWICKRIRPMLYYGPAYPVPVYPPPVYVAPPLILYPTYPCCYYGRPDGKFWRW
ncbi:MAG: hypothetical protein PHD04_00735 [Candidatus Pacebacteria bacterium]|nr:hypothetical protein [Candidatus Paceibacterota bacterium]